jgi:molybdopterin synthase catalytic subunit
MIRLQHEAIDPEEVRRSVEDEALGGVVLFCGEVRSVTGEIRTERVVYSAYEPMAIQEMVRIAQEAGGRWGARVAMVHRLGELLPGEIAVVTAAACPHRSEAFECCRFLIDQLKRDVPIWKEEYGPDGRVIQEGPRRVVVREDGIGE